MDSAPQRIGRLTALPQVLAVVSAIVKPVAPRQVRIAGAAGRILAEDIVVPVAIPHKAVAIRDGWAVAAAQTADAGGYAPALLSSPATWVDAGAALPAGADAVLPPDAVDAARPSEAMAAAAPGEGVAPAGGEAAAGAVLARAGQRLRAADCAAMAAADVIDVAIRAPRVRIACTRPVAVDAVASLLRAAVVAAGGDAEILAASGEPFEATLAAAGCDAVILVGGSGEGRNDGTVQRLKRCGRVDVHGIGLRPGETAALGAVGDRPVLCVPGRLDAALAVWLLVGDPLVRRLASADAATRFPAVRLARKIVSPVGIAEVVLLREDADGYQPVSGPHLPLAALAGAAGWTLVPPESEGYQAGSSVPLRPLP